MREVLGRMLNMRRHIAARIFVVLFACLYAVLLVFLMGFYFLQKGQIQEALARNALAMLEQADEKLSATLQEVEELSDFLLSDVSVRDYLYGPQPQPPTQPWFVNYENTLSLMRNYIIGRSRTIVGMGLVKGARERCFTGTIHAPIYRPDALPERNGLVVRPEYPYVVRAFSIAAGERAVLITQFAKDFWTQIYGKYVPEPDVLCVYDGHGRRIYESEGFARQPEAVWERMQSAAANGAAGKGPGDALLFARTNPAAGLTAVAFVPQSAVGALLGSLKRQLIALLLLLLFATAVLSRSLALGITRNIKTLQKNAERIGQGRYGDLLPVSARDEVGELGKTMQAMAARIALLVEDVNRRETRKREMELEILRAQVSPHFLYNALNTITYLSALQGAENIGRFAAALIDLLQAVLQPSDILIPLEQELAYAASYHEIMKYRGIYAVRLVLDVAPEARSALVMRMLLQPIVENALIHGIAPQQRDGVIRIAASVQARDLVLEVRDNGTGMTDEQIACALREDRNRNPMRFSGIGIRNVQDRIRLQFAREDGLTIESVPGEFTCVCLRVPLIRKEGADAQAAGGG